MAWYTSPSGITCVAAYDFVGASSLADSYINEANPGTFDCAPGVAPTWAYGTGVTFNGTTQYLTTGLIPASGWSIIARFSGAVSNVFMVIAGSQRTPGNYRFYLSPRTTTDIRTYGHGFVNQVAGRQASGVMAVAGANCYLNGAADGTVATGWDGASDKAVLIGANNTGSAVNFFAGSIQAIAIYSGTLTLADVQTITAAMNALPTAAANGLPIIAHWHQQIYGGGV